jgi:hypothetical protein
MSTHVPHSIPNTATAQSKSEETVNSTSALLVGDPSTCEESPNNGVDDTHSVQRTDQNRTLGPSEPGPAADSIEERSNNRPVMINQALEGLSLTNGPEISNRRKRVKEREHIYAQAVCSYQLNVSTYMLIVT